MSKAHPGFKNVASTISRREGVNIERANAILASGARKASTAAVKQNPRLKRIPGVKTPSY